MTGTGTRYKVLRLVWMTLAPALLVPAMAQARLATPKLLPDLAVTHVIVDSGYTPDYLIVDPSGSLTDFSIDIGVGNFGSAKAGASRMKIDVRQELGSRPRLDLTHLYFSVPPLRPNQQKTFVINVRKLRVKLAPLEPVQVIATANYNFHVPEQHYHNNTDKSFKIPVIAKQWKVTQWSSHSIGMTFSVGGSLQLDNKDQAQPGFVFRYDHYDSANQIFVYGAYGGLGQTTSLSSPVCNGSGSGTASHSPWPSPDSDFSIALSETRYAASVYTKNESPYTVPLQCAEGNPPPPDVRLVDLNTYVNSGGPVSASQGATKLSGTGNLTQGFESITYQWTFDADVP